jgi:hypothetical protein
MLKKDKILQIYFLYCMGSTLMDFGLPYCHQHIFAAKRVLLTKKKVYDSSSITLDFCIEAYVSMSYNIGAVKCVGGGGVGGKVNLLICDRTQDTP